MVAFGIVLLVAAVPLASEPSASPSVVLAERRETASGMAAVRLSAPRGVFDVSGPEPVLRFSARASNSLPVRVQTVELGILFAADPADLAGIDVGRLYERGRSAPDRGLGVFVRRVPVSIPLRGDAVVSVVAPVARGNPEPRAFQAHVLGYELAEVGSRLLLGLLSTAAAADEVAAVEALALQAEAAERLRARERWAVAASDLVNGFVAEAGVAIPERPSESETFRRVYAVRALGVLGGEAAERALRGLLREPDLSRFDEPLQVLRIARVVGSRLETPLAFALPPAAVTMRDVVAASLEDARVLERAGARVIEPERAAADPAGGGLAGDPEAAMADSAAPAASRASTGVETADPLVEGSPKETSRVERDEALTGGLLVTLLVSVATAGASLGVFAWVRRGRGVPWRRGANP